MNSRRTIIYVCTALLIGFFCTSCGSGPIATVKGFAKAYVIGDPDMMNDLLTKDLRIEEDDINIWEEIDTDFIEVDEDDYQKAISNVMSNARYKLHKQEGSKAVIKVTLNFKHAVKILLDACEDEDIREELEEKFTDMDDEDFFETFDFEVRLKSDKWVITEIENFYLFKNGFTYMFGGMDMIFG